MGEAPFDDAGGGDDGVGEDADPGTSISTSCPGSSVNSSGGTSPVPVSRTLPGGTGFSRNRKETRPRRSSSCARSTSRRRAAPVPHRRGSASGSRAARRRGERERPARAHRRRHRPSPAAGRAGSRLDLPGRDVVADRDADDLAAGSDDEADFRLGDIPGRVRADADRLAGTDRAAAAGVLEEELRPVGVVDERVHVLDGALLNARISRTLICDTRAPDLRRIDGAEQPVRLGQRQPVGIEWLISAAALGLDDAVLDGCVFDAVRANEPHPAH